VPVPIHSATLKAEPEPGYEQDPDWQLNQAFPDTTATADVVRVYNYGNVHDVTAAHSRQLPDATVCVVIVVRGAAHLFIAADVQDWIE